MKKKKKKKLKSVHVYMRTTYLPSYMHLNQIQQLFSEKYLFCHGNKSAIYNRILAKTIISSRCQLWLDLLFIFRYVCVNHLNVYVGI